MNIEERINELEKEVEALKKEVNCLRSNDNSNAKLNDRKFDKDIIKNVLKTYGITANLKGYRYIIDSIEYLFYNNDTDILVTKNLYYNVFKKNFPNYYCKKDDNRKTPIYSNVERGIRHAISIAKSKKTNSFSNDFEFDSSPTNAEFIFTLADKYYDIR